MALYTLQFAFKNIDYLVSRQKSNGVDIFKIDPENYQSFDRTGIWIEPAHVDGSNDVRMLYVFISSLQLEILASDVAIVLSCYKKRERERGETNAERCRG